MSGSGIILAIETSQRAGSVAVLDRAGAVHVEMLRAEARQDDDLLPAIDRLMRRLGLESGDLKGGAVGVSIGPGGFTGLRIAISTAKMLGLSLGVKLLAVPSALVAAQGHEGSGPIMVALAAKRGTVWRTHARRADAQWMIMDDPAPGLADASSLSLRGIEAVLADEHFPDDARQACAAAKLPIIEPRFEAANCLAIARRMLERGQTTDPVHLLPLYPREPEAVTLWVARQARHQP